MSGIEFQAWPKISRLFRPCIISEKIDGTNSAVGVVDVREVDRDHPLASGYDDDLGAIVYAQSRTRIITPADDNFGFARWVSENASQLARALGFGVHAGEWWGSGIQRGYGLQKGDKRWSLFNVTRHRQTPFGDLGLPNVATVPVLYEGTFSTHTVDHQVEILRSGGSQAAPGWMTPEGVVTFHVASNQMFKTTLEKDEAPKGANQ